MKPFKSPRKFLAELDADAVASMGRHLAADGVGIVYGGGRAGLMGALADAALAGGGQVVGVIPEALVVRELGHRELTRLEVVADMHERKQRMATLGDAFTMEVCNRYPEELKRKPELDPGIVNNLRHITNVRPALATPLS
mgnify:CR=1 FL=1